MTVFNTINWSPLDYVEAAVLAQEIGKEMLLRLDWMTLQPSTVLDVGCGTGETSQLLQARYPKAKTIALDLSEAMLAYTKEHTAITHSVCADAEQLPLRSQSVDLIFAHFLLPWHSDPSKLLNEWRRVLRPEGILLLSALGPDTLQEYRAMQNIAVLPYCMDMHDLGDLLLQCGFSDPVLDVDHYTMTYQSEEKMLAELRDSGMLSAGQTPAFPKASTWSVPYEIIYAHAFVPAKKEQVAEDGVVKIPLSHLRQQLLAK